MKKAMIVVLAILLISSSAKTAAALTTTFVKLGDATKDTKSAQLSVIDQVWLSAEPIIINSLTRVNVLVNRVTKKVEYVWSYKYNCYIRPKFGMPNVQSLYDFVHSKGK